MNSKEISNETEAKEIYVVRIKQIREARNELQRLQKLVEYLDNEIEELCDFAENNGWELIDDPIIRVD